MNKKLAGILLPCGLALLADAWAAPPLYSISTVAGSDPGGYGGDGGSAVQALLSVPKDVALDSQGNLYVADYGNNRVRRIDSGTGAISTVAGNGVGGYAGDGGPAVAAQLNGPIAVATDAQDNLYVADIGNYRIRRIDRLTGVIRTVAGNGAPSGDGDGGPATDGGVDSPSALTLDGQGNLFFSDTGIDRVRRVDHATGVVTTVAGNGSDGYSGDGGPAVAAQLSQPQGLAVDAQGNVYVADSYNSRIRYIDRATGLISTLAGVGPAQSSGDGGPATDAGLNFPSDVALDSQGNLYIVDGNSMVRRIDHGTGTINTVAGTGGLDYSGDGGAALQAGFDAFMLALDGRGQVFIADYGNNRVRKLTVMTANPKPIECLLNWAEASFPTLFFPPGAASKFQSPYTYRYYPGANAYLGVSYADNHAYYLTPDGSLLDEGDAARWIGVAGCQ